MVYVGVAQGVHVHTSTMLCLYSHMTRSPKGVGLIDCIVTMAERQKSRPASNWDIGGETPREGKRAPCGMIRLFDAVEDGNTVCTRDEGGDRIWSKKFSPMPTQRRRSIALCTGTTLIVAGGEGESYDVLSTVEMMNTGTHQWSTATDLPELTYLGSATVCWDQLYILSGLNQLGAATNSMYTCSVSALLQSCVPSSLEAANLERTSLEDKASVWRQVADLPVALSTCKSFHGQVMVIGGKKDSPEVVPTTVVFMYDLTTNSWEIISHMTTGWWNCYFSNFCG